MVIHPPDGVKIDHNPDGFLHFGTEWQENGWLRQSIFSYSGGVPSQIEKEVQVQMTVREAKTLVGEKLIRNVLATNAVASGACGLLLPALPGMVSDLTGPGSRTALMETGWFLIIFVGFLIWAATRRIIPPRVVLAFAVVDGLWVVIGLRHKGRAHGSRSLGRGSANGI